MDTQHGMKMRGEFTLCKYNRDTGELLDTVRPNDNVIETVGLEAIANRMTDGGIAWSAANMYLRVAGTGASTLSQTDTDTTVTSVVTGGTLQVVWRDESTDAFTPTGVYIRTTSDGSDLTSFTAVSGWGAKAGNETWEYQYTLTPGIATGASDIQNPTNQARTVARKILGTGATGFPSVTLTNDESQMIGDTPTYSVSASDEAHSASGAVYTITARRAGGTAFSKTGDRIVYSGSGNDLVQWYDGASPVSVIAQQQLNLSYTITFS